MEHAFSVLEDVAGHRTRWRSVYDGRKRRTWFRTQSETTLRFVDLAAFDLSCRTPVQILDMQTAGSGDVSTAFVDHTYEASFASVKKAFNGTSFLRHLSDEALAGIARFPAAMRCTE